MTAKPKTLKFRPLVGMLLGYAARWVGVAVVAAGLGAGAALATVAVGPNVTAKLAGPQFCKSGAAASIGYAYDLQFADWRGQVWRLPTPELQCAGAKGLIDAKASAAFDATWYAAGAAGAAAMASIVYAMWIIASGIAAPQGLALRKANNGVPQPDLAAEFLAECCEVDAKKRTPAAQLYAAYAAWSRAKGHRPPARKSLTRDWRRLGLRPRGFLGTSSWRGARLKEHA